MIPLKYSTLLSLQRIQEALQCLHAVLLHGNHPLSLPTSHLHQNLLCCTTTATKDTVTFSINYNSSNLISWNDAKSMAQSSCFSTFGEWEDSWSFPQRSMSEWRHARWCESTGYDWIVSYNAKDGMALNLTMELLHTPLPFLSGSQSTWGCSRTNEIVWSGN